MEKDTVVIVGMARTPQGNLSGCFKDLAAWQLGAAAIQAAIERSHVAPEQINEVIMGCVLPAGQGQAPARQAALAAGLPVSTPCTTINKMCGSGMKAIMLGYDSLLAGSNHIMVAGGMESMSQAPYLLPKGRQGYRLGHGELLDHLMLDGLEDAYEKRKAMGYFAEQCAKEYGFTREQQDQYATASLERAQKAIRDKSFATEITPVTIKERQGEKIIDTDEHPLSVNIEKIPSLSTIFIKDGTITAANSSSIADGAAAVVLMTLAEAEKQGIKPLAKIIAHSEFAKAPHQFTTAPIDAIKHLLQKINWTIDQVDLFEINEAFAVVAMAAMQELAIPHEKLNIHGSGCALGHPIGATGARIIVTLLAALQRQQLKRGVAALCIGGGEATAIAIERM
jgi:acetyl-CoA C-acetyltransferase